MQMMMMMMQQQQQQQAQQEEDQSSKTAEETQTEPEEEEDATAETFPVPSTRTNQINRDELRAAVQASLQDHAQWQQQQKQQDDTSLSPGEQDEQHVHKQQLLLLQEQLETVQQRYHDLIRETRNADELLRTKVNVMAVRQLQQELVTIQEREVKMRRYNQQRLDAMRQRQQTVQAAIEQFLEAKRAVQLAKRQRRELQKQQKQQKQQEKEEQIGTVVKSMEQLEELLSPEHVFATHDERMQEWCRNIVQETTDSLPMPQVDLPDLKEWQKQQKEETQNDPNGHCALPSQVAQVIQTALSSSSPLVEELYDHATHAAWIVHEQTSETFQPPATITQQHEHEEEQQDDKRDAWWTQYIPDDWIDAVAFFNSENNDGGDFFSGVATTISDTSRAAAMDQISNLVAQLPLPHHLAKPTTTTGDISGGNHVNPPETVLHPLVLPGACWPLLNGNGGGVLTMALPYSIQVSAISLDHASRRLLLVNNNNNNENTLASSSSAPKTVRVVGFPPCDIDNNDDNCQGRTYDAQEPLHVLELHYNISLPAVSQTFFVNYEEDDEGENDAAVHQDDLPPPGSCTAPPVDVDDEPQESGGASAGTCGSPLLSSSSSTAAAQQEHPSITREDRIAALRFEFVENNGNPDYTCVYRIRVHGEIVTSTTTSTRAAQKGRRDDEF